MIRKCDHCGEDQDGYSSLTRGSKTYYFCHPDDPNKPDCYRLVTVYGEPIGKRIKGGNTVTMLLDKAGTDRMLELFKGFKNG